MAGPAVKESVDPTVHRGLPAITVRMACLNASEVVETENLGSLAVMADPAVPGATEAMAES